MIYPNAQVKMTCRTHAISETLPRTLMMDGFISIPTIKSSNAIPIFPNDWNAVFACNNQGKKILMAVPAIIYQIIIGCLSAFKRPTLISTIPIMIASDTNICSAIYVY